MRCRRAGLEAGSASGSQVRQPRAPFRSVACGNPGPRASEACPSTLTPAAYSAPQQGTSSRRPGSHEEAGTEAPQSCMSNGLGARCGHCRPSLAGPSRQTRRQAAWKPPARARKGQRRSMAAPSGRMKPPWRARVPPPLPDPACSIRRPMTSWTACAPMKARSKPFGRRHTVDLIALPFDEALRRHENAAKRPPWRSPRTVGTMRSGKDAGTRRRVRALFRPFKGT